MTTGVESAQVRFAVCAGNMETDAVATGCILTDYLECAMASATFDKLSDGSFAGRVPGCQGVIALGETLMDCRRLLRSTLEDWLLLGLRMGHSIPAIKHSFRPP